MTALLPPAGESAAPSKPAGGSEKRADVRGPGAPVGNKNALGAGRPPLYTPELGRAFLQKMGEGLSWRAAAAELDISAQSFYNWEKEIPEFAALAELARGKRGAFLERRLLAEDNNAKARSAALLLRNADSSYCEKLGVEHSGGVDYKITDPLKITFVDSAADTAQILAAVSVGEYSEVNTNAADADDGDDEDSAAGTAAADGNSSSTDGERDYD